MVFDQVNELINRIKHGAQWITLWITGDIAADAGRTRTAAECPRLACG